MAFSPFQFTHWLYHPGTPEHSHFIKPIQVDRHTCKATLQRKKLILFPYNGGVKPLLHKDTPTAPEYFD